MILECIVCGNNISEDIKKYPVTHGHGLYGNGVICKICKPKFKKWTDKLKITSKEDADGVNLNDKIKIIKQCIRNIKCMSLQNKSIKPEDIIKEFEEEIKYLETIQTQQNIIIDFKYLYPCVIKNTKYLNYEIVNKKRNGSKIKYLVNISTRVNNKDVIYKDITIIANNIKHLEKSIIYTEKIIKQIENKKK
jgi:hypothetical protein